VTEVASYSTEAELKLWSRLRNRSLAGAKFYRQYAVGPYTVDFISVEHRVVIEVDGGQHQVRQESDAKRTAYLEGCGYRVLRFWNNDVLSNVDEVAELIRRYLLESGHASR
jgi:very-short-patch-repair endonuclease